jgi:hypothetical protein
MVELRNAKEMIEAAERETGLRDFWDDVRH